VRGAKGIIYKNIAEFGVFLRQCVIVLFFTFVEAAVLQHNDLAGSEVETAVYPVGFQTNGTSEQLRQTFGDRCQRVCGFELPFDGATQMRGDHHPRSGIQCHFYGRYRGTYPSIIGDLTLGVERGVEVGANKYPLTPGMALFADFFKS
jgi:hypothetical protein